LARPTCSTGPVLKNQRRGAIISEISEALRAFSEFDCLWRATTRVKLFVHPAYSSGRRTKRPRQYRT
jgi:hypothetical protein